MADRTNTLICDEAVEEKKPAVWDYLRLSVPRLIIFAILLTYLLFGATVLHILEKSNDDATPVTQPSSIDLAKMVEQLRSVSQNDHLSDEERKRRTKETIKKIYADLDDDDGISWTFSQSFLYATASLTRIGSTVQPETFFGRVFVFFYTFFGVPLLLIFVADLGKFFVALLPLVIDHAQRKLKLNFLSSISANSDDFDPMAFIFAISVVLGIYVVGVSMAVLLRCGGSVLENIYTGLLIVFGIGPAPLAGTENCAGASVFSFIPILPLILSAPIALSLTTVLIDQLGVEWIRKIHLVGRKLKGESRQCGWRDEK